MEIEPNGVLKWPHKCIRWCYENPTFLPCRCINNGLLNKSFIHKLPYKEQNKDNKQSHYSRLLSTATVKRLSHALHDSSFCSFACSSLDSHVNEWPWVNHTRMEIKSRVLTHKMNHATCWEPNPSEQLSQHTEVTSLHRYSRWGVFLWLSICGRILDSFFNFWPERVQLVFFTITNELGGHFETGWKINSFKCPLGKTWPFTG